MGCIVAKKNFTVVSSSPRQEEVAEPVQAKTEESHVVFKQKTENGNPSRVKMKKLDPNLNLLKKKCKTKSYSVDFTNKFLLELEKVKNFEKRINFTFKKDCEAILNCPAKTNLKEELEENILSIPEEQKTTTDCYPSTDLTPVEIKDNSSDEANNMNEDNEEFFKEIKSFVGGFSTKEFTINILSTDNTDNKLNNMITGLNVRASDKSKKNSCGLSINTIETSKCRDRKSMASTVTNNPTLDYSSMDDLDKSPNYSPCKILRKFNLNPYHNFNVVKKYFIYQLKKSFLQAKRFVLNNVIHGQNRFDLLKNPNYHEIFSNYSQISTCEVSDYIKYEDKNVKINNYFINKHKVLGKGGFSTVYLCKNLKDEREYAAKITDKTTRANARKKKYDYVKDEVNILKRLYSRYVVKTYEILETKSECLIFMELMKNNSLFSKISRLDDFKIWKYFRNLICGVEHCHEIAKIVHRDINVNNLLISDDDNLKLSDFGVSMIIEDDSDLISINSGPTTYTPPEKKITQNTHYKGKPADIWCCGVALYHMIYKRPFPLEKQEYKLNCPDLPEDFIDSNLKELLLNLLDEDPSKRYTFNDMKKNSWITKNGEFPLPDIHEEALEYVYSLTSLEIQGYKDEPIKGEFSPY